MPSSSRRRFPDPQQLIEAARAILPGAAIALVIGAAAHRIISEWLPVSSLLVAVIAGILLRTAGWVPWWAERGLAWVSKSLLRIGIVFLGFQLTLSDLVGLGWEVLVIIIGTAAITFAAIRLLGPLLRVDRGSAVLLAAGTSICGASAVAAAAAAIDRGDGRDRWGQPISQITATSLAVVTLCGTVLMLGLPVAVDMAEMDDRSAGALIGASVHEVGQVVAAGGMVGAAALAAATSVKLARILLLVPAVVALRLETRNAATTSKPGAAAPLPLFVLGFLAAIALNSTPAVSISADTADFLMQITIMLITIAMAGVGAGVNLRQLLSTGGRAMLLGAVGSSIAVVTAAIGVQLLL